MAESIINSLFTRNGVPATNISDLNPQPDGKDYPRVRIWEVSDISSILIVGDTIGTGQNTDGIMLPVEDGGVEDGFYTFTFSDTIGFDAAKSYLVRTDGGGSLEAGERYQSAEITPDGAVSQNDIDNIADAVWDENVTEHLLLNSTGLTIAETKANTDQLFLDVASLQTALDLLLKYDTNRTKIDTTAKTLTVFDDDCITPLRVFKLLDSSGVPSIDSVCERTPVTASDGKPVC